MNMPPLIRFLLKWSVIGMAAGWLFVGLLLYADLGGVRSLLGRAESPLLWVFVFGFSFGISFAQVTVLAAVLLRDDFGGRGSGNDRLERWRAGGSAQLRPDDD
ncbi:hypothetical protein DK847_14190 [Aestuariivirga litoralis]|uniref:Uncharacterized protein n=1 Tax=Aestuariivirga litoralis TaxID=2650924 RepID=A0A2W2AUP1_9HYPH|nr:hypothetical protein [Aestuariivirga litoralis]PZF76330.1 hypothetical protein DK847_14190 [Aestuariivirga litoralis]